MLNVVLSNQFRKDLKRISKRGYDLEHLDYVCDKLAKGEALEAKYKDHNLTGNFAGFRECHIESDWLLIYRINKNELILFLAYTGTHSDLF